ncbi:hypothetical protein ACG2E4_16555 [Halalkalibaculum sp. DA384]
MADLVQVENIIGRHAPMTPLTQDKYGLTWQLSLGTLDDVHG